MEFGTRARVTAFIIVVSGGAVLGANHAAWSGQQELDPSGLGRLGYFDFLLPFVEGVSCAPRISRLPAQLSLS